MVVSDGSEYGGIVVLGFPRSGTTLLRRVLNAHPKICCPPETELLCAAARFLHEQPFSGGVSFGVLAGLSFSGFQERETISRLRSFVFGFLREIADRDGSAIWAEKTANNSFYIDEIERLCQDSCKYICMVRHPLDAVCSLKDLTDKMRMHQTEIHDYVRRYPVPLEAYAHAWSDVNSRLRAFIRDHPQNTLLIRYEDLTGNPEAEVDRISEFIEAPADAKKLIEEATKASGPVGFGDWKTYQKTSIDRSSVDRWKNLDDWLVRRLSEIVNPVAESLRYPPIDPPAELTRDAAHHRLEQVLRIQQLKAGRPSGGPVADEK